MASENVEAPAGIIGFVLWSSVRALVGQAIYVALVLWVAQRWHGAAVLMYWFNAAFTVCYAVLLRGLGLLAGVFLAIFKLFRVQLPEGEMPALATAIRVIEAAVLVYASYFLFVRIYPGSKFLWVFD